MIGATGTTDGTKGLSLETAILLLPTLIYLVSVESSGAGAVLQGTPIMQFLLGALVCNEPLAPARLAGFAVVWIALGMFVVEGIVVRRREAAGSV